MSWNRACGLASLLLSACTRPNFAYGDGNGTAADEDDTAGTSEVDPTRGEVDPTRGDTTRGDTTRGGSESEGTLDTGPSCVPMFELPFDIHSSSELWLSSARDCPGPMASYRVRVEAQRDSSLQVELCLEGCECGEALSMLQFDAPLPDLATGCYELTVEFAAGEGGACVVQAYKLTDSSNTMMTVVSNVVGPSFPQPFALQFAEEPTTTCALGCKREVGHYALVIDELEIPPDETPVPHEGYTLINYGSGIDDDCSAVSRWAALREP